MGSPVVSSVPNSQTRLGLLAAEPIKTELSAGIGLGEVVHDEHAVPFQCRTEKSANAQAFVGLKSRTALRMPSLGPATTDHAVPFQCSYRES
jgi:hypothetical protein